MLRADRRRWVALYVLCGGLLMIVLDMTIVNVALPSIATDLHVTSADLSWVVNAYLISFGGLLLLAGRIGDLIGHRAVFLAGLLIFVTASLGCAVATGPTTLIIARLVQGVGGALTSAVILSIVLSLFPEPADRAKAIGIYGFVASAGGSVGLLAGGALTDGMGWRSIFLINIPIGMVTAWLALRYVDVTGTRDRSQRADGRSATLLTLGLMAGVYAIIEASQQPASITLTAAAGAIVLLMAFVARQARIASPLLPLRLFRSRIVAAANGVQALLVVGMFGTFFLGALYLQDVRGYDPVEVGLAFLPETLAMAAMSLRLAASLTGRIGAYRTLLIALVVLTAGLLLFTRVPVHGSYVLDLAPALVLTGLGAGLGFPALTGIAMSAATPADTGVASGLFNTTTQIGGAIGLAVLSSLASRQTRHARAAGADSLAALTSGYHLAFLVAAGAAALAVLIAAIALRPGQRSNTSSSVGRLQQTSTSPAAGSTRGVVVYSAVPESTGVTQVWQTPLRHDQRVGTSHASASSSSEA
jgi:EmrB/QacA subfamily drug resistance transporter